MGKTKEAMRKIYNRANAAKLKDTDFSLICSNCNGALLLHDLGIRFNSPFVNLWMKPEDFIKFLQDIPYYLGCDMRFVEEAGISYPVGVLDDVKIFFQHYATPDEAKKKWQERAERINFDKLFILFTDRDGCTYKDLCDFDALPYAHKIVFTHVPYPELKSACYLKGWETEESVGICFAYKSRWSIKKHYDDFDYISWFNCEM